jgi:hypothetical protein
MKIMNKYQEALKTIEKSCISVAMEFNFGKLFEEDEKALSNLQELVDKATPKKLIYSNDPLFAYMVFCPVCSKSIPFTNSYCGHCGQKLDWSDEYDK